MTYSAHLFTGALLAVLVTNFLLAYDDQEMRQARLDARQSRKGEAENFSNYVNDQLNKDVELVLTQVSKQDLSVEDKLKELRTFGSVLDETSLASNQSGDNSQQNQAETLRDNQSLAKIQEAMQTSNWNSLDKFKNVFSLIKAKLVNLGGYLSRRFNLLREATKKTKFGERLSHGAKKIRLHLAKWPDFITFKAKFHKIYKSPREELYRQMVYLRTQSIVLVQHVRCLLRLDRHSLKATQFADWTEEEFEKQFNNERARYEKDDLKPYPEEELNRLRHLARIKSLERRKHQKQHPRIKRNTDDENMSDDEEYDPMEIYENEDMVNGDEKMLDDDVLRSLREKALEEEEDMDVDTIGDHMDIDGITTEELEEELESFVNANNFDPIDLRSTGCVGPIKDQGNCGACFAFSATSGAEFHNCMADNGELTVFNPMFVSDCGNYYDFHLDGCNGGIVSKALRFIAHAGHYEQLVYEMYKSSSGKYRSNTCPFPEPPGNTRAEKRVNLKGWARTQVKALDEAIFYAIEFADWHTYLQTVGPIYINLANPKNFKDWGYGIYDGSPNESDVVGIHTMLLVGHLKDDQGKGYWLVGNSHGVLWGDNGYLRLSDLGVERQVKLAIGMSSTGSPQQNVKSLYRK